MLDGLDAVAGAGVHAPSTTSTRTSTRSLTPDDFLAWLAGWVGIALDEGWDEAAAAGDRRAGGRAVPAARHRRRAGRPGRDPDRRDGRDRRERGDRLVRRSGRRAAGLGRAAGRRAGDRAATRRRSTPSGWTRSSPRPSRPTSCTGSRSSRAPRRLDVRRPSVPSRPRPAPARRIRPCVLARRRRPHLAARAPLRPATPTRPRCVARTDSCHRDGIRASHAPPRHQFGRIRPESDQTRAWHARERPS